MDGCLQIHSGTHFNYIETLLASPVDTRTIGDYHLSAWAFQKGKGTLNRRAPLPPPNDRPLRPSSGKPGNSRRRRRCCLCRSSNRCFHLRDRLGICRQHLVAVHEGCLRDPFYLNFLFCSGVHKNNITHPIDWVFLLVHKANFRYIMSSVLELPPQGLPDFKACIYIYILPRFISKWETKILQHNGSNRYFWVRNKFFQKKTIAREDWHILRGRRGSQWGAQQAN